MRLSYRRALVLAVTLYLRDRWARDEWRMSWVAACVMLMPLASPALTSNSWVDASGLIVLAVVLGVLVYARRWRYAARNVETGDLTLRWAPTERDQQPGRP